MNKAEVLQRIDDGWRRLAELVDDIHPMRFVEAAKGDWSPKDHVAHVTAWENYLLAILEKRDRYTSMGVGDLRGRGTDEINDAVVMAHRTVAPDVILTEFAETHRTVRSAIESLADSDLQRPRADFQPDIEPVTEEGDSGEESLLDEIEWNTWDHYAQHTEWLAALITR